jgi:hypothetical protein
MFPTVARPKFVWQSQYHLKGHVPKKVLVNPLSPKFVDFRNPQGSLSTPGFKNSNAAEIHVM